MSKSPTPSPQERAMATLRVRGGPPLASLALTPMFSICFGARFVSEKSSAAIVVRQLRGYWVLSTPPKAEIPESMNQTNGAAKPLVCGNECTQSRPGIPPSLPHPPSTKDPPSSLNGPRSPTHTPKAYWDPCSRDPRRQMLFGLKQPCQWNSTEFNK